MLKRLLGEINQERFFEYLRGFTLNLGLTFTNSVKGKRILLHIIAIIASIAIIISGIDWDYFLFFHETTILQIFLFPAVPLGAFIPLFFPPLIYLYAKNQEKPYLEPLALGMTRAGVVALFWAGFYKSLTGRVGPELFEEFDEDYSKDFAFGLLRRGVFEGWPSSHTTVAFTIAAVYFFFRPETEASEINDPFTKCQRFAFLYAIYIGFGVSTNIHWLSDAVAGVFVGIAVGLSGQETLELRGTQTTDRYSKEFYLTFILVFLAILFSIINLQGLYDLI